MLARLEETLFPATNETKGLCVDVKLSVHNADVMKIGVSISCETCNNCRKMVVLSIGEVWSDRVQLILSDLAQEEAPALVERLAVGIDEEWQCVETSLTWDSGRAVCDVGLGWKGTEYRFRVDNQEVSLLGAPPEPKVIGLGRNVCLIVKASEVSNYDELKVDWRCGCSESGRIALLETKDDMLMAFPETLRRNESCSFRLVAMKGSLSAASKAVTWSSVVPAPRLEALTHSQIVLALPAMTDTIYSAILECRDDEGDWRRLGSTIAGSEVVICQFPSDIVCSFRARYCCDFRTMGASTYFRDESAPLRVETAPKAPSFVAEKDKLLAFWQSTRGVVYSLRAYDANAAQFAKVYVGLERSVNVHDFFQIEPGEWLCLRLARALRDGSDAPAAATVCVAAGPRPPKISWTEEHLAVSWDGAMDASKLPVNVAPPCDVFFELQVASCPLLSQVKERTGQRRRRRRHSSIVAAASSSPVFRVAARSQSAAVARLTLAPGMRHLLRVRMSTPNGEATSAAVEVSCNPAPPAAPEPPRLDIDYFVSVVGHRAPFVRLNWSSPQNRGAPVDRFLVQVHRRGDTWRLLYQGPQATCGDDATLHLEGALFAQYRVKAGSCLGWSSYSEVATLDAPDGLESWIKPAQPVQSSSACPHFVVDRFETLDEVACGEAPSPGPGRAVPPEAEAPQSQASVMFNWPKEIDDRPERAAEGECGRPIDDVLAKLQKRASYPVSRAAVAKVLAEYRRRHAHPQRGAGETIRELHPLTNSADYRHTVCCGKRQSSAKHTQRAARRTLPNKNCVL